MTALVILIVLALVVPFAFFLGGGPVLVVLALIAFLAAAGWFAMTYASGRRPTREVRRTPSQELLGPGGPDDPERDAT